MVCLINEVIEILYSKLGMPISTKIIYKYGGFITPTAKIIKNMVNVINNKNTTDEKIKTKQVLIGIKPNKHKRLDYKLITFFILPPSKQVLFDRLSNRDMKDKLIADERMKQFEHDVLHWINYDYVVINNNLEDCYKKILDLIQAEIKNTSKDYDKDFIRNHVEKLTS